MTYKHIEGESDRDREKRHAAEYQTYLQQCSEDGVEPTNYMNWNVSRKFSEKIANGERATERRNDRR